MAAPSAHGLHRLVYASQATAPLAADKLDRILLHARLNNAGARISGLLLFQEGRFLQVLEGSAGALLDLLERLQRDRRHANLTILEWGPADRHALAETPMTYVSARNFSDEQRTSLMEALDLAGADAVMPADEAVTRRRVAALLKAFEPQAA